MDEDEFVKIGDKELNKELFKVRQDGTAEPELLRFMAAHTLSFLL